MLVQDYGDIHEPTILRELRDIPLVELLRLRVHDQLQYQENHGYVQILVHLYLFHLALLSHALCLLLVQLSQQEMHL